MQFNYLILLAGVAASVAGSPITDVEDASVATNDSSPNNSNVCIVSIALRIRWNFNLVHELTRGPSDHQCEREREQWQWSGRQTTQMPILAQTLRQLD